MPMHREGTFIRSSALRACTTHHVYVISTSPASCIALQEEAEAWASPAGQAGAPLITAMPRLVGNRTAPQHPQASKKRKAAALDEDEAEALLDERAHAWSQAHQFAALG